MGWVMSRLDCIMLPLVSLSIRILAILSTLQAGLDKDEEQLLSGVLMGIIFLVMVGGLAQGLWDCDTVTSALPHSPAAATLKW